MPVTPEVVASTAFTSSRAPSAKADEWDKKAVIAVRGAVQIGGIVLEPGKYVLKFVKHRFCKLALKHFGPFCFGL